jgi:hypothetical protein
MSNKVYAFEIYTYRVNNVLLCLYQRTAHAMVDMYLNWVRRTVHAQVDVLHAYRDGYW